MTANRLRPLLAGLLLVPLAGCGDRTAEVTGTVQLQSQPLPSGVVTFFPGAGVPMAAMVVNGAYSVPALPYGTYRVSVAPLAPEQPVTSGPGGPRKPTGSPEAAAAPAAKGPQIPAKYGSVDTSGLSVPVDQAKVTYPISLD
ncbi:MAG: hypothetical protein U0804_09250 [Gemmataceae bacterium]